MANDFFIFLLDGISFHLPSFLKSMLSSLLFSSRHIDGSSIINKEPEFSIRRGKVSGKKKITEMR